MNREQRVGINKAAKKIITIAKTQKDALRIIGDTMVKIATNAMNEERVLWEKAIKETPGIGPKTIRKIIDARYGNETSI